MEGGHAGHIDPVHVDVDTDPPQHGHDGLAVALLDALLEHHLVREAHPPPAGVLPGEHARPPGHLALAGVRDGAEPHPGQI